MKVSKVGVWVTLVITLVFAALGVMFVLLPNNSPLQLKNGTLKTAHSSSGIIYIYGELENTTDKNLNVTYMEIEVETTREIIGVYTDEPFVIASGAIYDLHEDEWVADSYYAPESINKITATIDGVEYTVYESMPIYTVAAIAMFIFAVIFAAVTISTFVGTKKQQKRYDNMNATLANMEGNGVLLGGTYTEKSAAGKNAAKTAASVAAGAVSAAFLGVGVYKVYGGNAQREFIVTDNGLYIGVPSKNPINFAQMNFIQKGKFGDCQITTKPKEVILLNRVTTEMFRFNTANSNTTSEQLAARLQALIDYEPEPVAPESEATPPVEDPFTDL